MFISFKWFRVYNSITIQLHASTWYKSGSHQGL